MIATVMGIIGMLGGRGSIINPGRMIGRVGTEVREEMGREVVLVEDAVGVGLGL